MLSEHIERVKKRYITIKELKSKDVLRIQHTIISSIRDYLSSKGFIEILSPIIGPVTDPGIRGAKQVSFGYYGHKFKVMSSAILYKQMAMSSLGRIFFISPNIRLEPIETIMTGRHLTQFYQVDVELSQSTYFDAMKVAEGLVVYVIKKVKKVHKDELNRLGRRMRIPKYPFKKITYSDALEILSKNGFEMRFGKEIPWDLEIELSKMFDEPFFVYDYPKSSRGFYDREDPERPGILRDFDLLYPEGYGEAVSGGEREYEYEKVIERMKATGEDLKKYGWYLDMLKIGIPLSSGFGIGVERLTRFVCGLEYISDASPFPKLAGVISP